MALPFILVAYSDWHFRWLVRRLFAKRRSDPAQIHELWAVLDFINEECSAYTFAAEKVATVPFRGSEITVAFGTVGWSDSTSHMRKCVYTVADLEQAFEICLNSDVFELAFAGSTHSIFWLNLGKLLQASR